MKIFKRIVSIVCLILIAALTGCGDAKKAEEINSYLEENYSAPASQEETYPESESLLVILEEAGFTTEKFDRFEEIGIETERIKAAKDEEYLDICYNVSVEEDVQKIIEYYMQNYNKCNLLNDEGTIICYSSDSVMEQAGLNQ